MQFTVDEIVSAIWSSAHELRWYSRSWLHFARLQSTFSNASCSSGSSSSSSNSGSDRGVGSDAVSDSIRTNERGWI